MLISYFLIVGNLQGQNLILYGQSIAHKLDVIMHTNN